MTRVRCCAHKKDENKFDYDARIDMLDCTAHVLYGMVFAKILTMFSATKVHFICASNLASEYFMTFVV